jgi:hypothetical protein
MRSGSYALILKAGPVDATTRHNIIRNEISEICQVDGAPASKERSLDRLLGPRNETNNNGVVDEESAERPVDMIIDNWLLVRQQLSMFQPDAHEHQSMRSS